MDLNFLTELGNKLLERPKFQKYLGDISASQLNNELSRLTSELKDIDEEIEAPLSGIGIEPGETQEDSRLTREQKKQNRQNKREQRKKDREQKREEIKKKIDKLRQKIIPRLETYTITGRIYDSQTAEPLKGVKVKVGIDQTQITGQSTEVSVGVDTPKELSNILESDVKLATDFKPYVPLEVLIPEGQNTTTNNKDNCTG